MGNPNHDAQGKFATGHHTGKVPKGSLWPEGPWDPEEPPVKQHLKEFHPILKLLHRSDELVNQHIEEHKHRMLSHHHGSAAEGDEYPTGWTTGENVIYRQ